MQRGFSPLRGAAYATQANAQPGLPQQRSGTGSTPPVRAGAGASTSVPLAVGGLRGLRKQPRKELSEEELQARRQPASPPGSHGRLLPAPADRQPAAVSAYGRARTPEQLVFHAIGALNTCCPETPAS